MQEQPQPYSVLKAAAETAKKFAENRDKVQIAFFGGSFTAIDPLYMQSLLEAGKEAVERFGFQGIRISTRPDKIDDEILRVLKEYKVTSIELGAQSMLNSVLEANNRGHTAEEVCIASEKIRKNGFELGLQMMTGLYQDNDSGAMQTAEKLIELKPDTLRIYPTIVLKNTKLYEYLQQGIYKPQTLEEAVNLCARLIPMFEKQNIRVIRVGLHDESALKESMVAGPYHPAFRELCQSRIFLNTAVQFLAGFLEKTENMRYNIRVHTKMLSAALGQKRMNIGKFRELGYDVKIFADDNISPREYEISSEEKTFTVRGKV